MAPCKTVFHFYDCFREGIQQRRLASAAAAAVAGVRPAERLPVVVGAARNEPPSGDPQPVARSASTRKRPRPDPTLEFRAFQKRGLARLALNWSIPNQLSTFGTSQTFAGGNQSLVVWRAPHFTQGGRMC